METQSVEVEENGKKVKKTETRDVFNPVPLDSSKVAADFHIDYRQKGLLWFSTYRVGFAGNYAIPESNGARENVHDQVAVAGEASGV